MTLEELQELGLEFGQEVEVTIVSEQPFGEPLERAVIGAETHTLARPQVQAEMLGKIIRGAFERVEIYERGLDPETKIWINDRSPLGKRMYYGFHLWLIEKVECL